MILPFDYDIFNLTPNIVSELVLDFVGFVTLAGDRLGSAARL